MSAPVLSGPIPSAPILTVESLTVRFGGLVALNALDFDLRAGEFVGLIGPNGSGKTTFFNALTGIYAPASGSVTLSGTDITGQRPQRIYDTGITRTFQRLRLASTLSVFDNLMTGNHRNLDQSVVTNLFARRNSRHPECALPETLRDRRLAIPSITRLYLTRFRSVRGRCAVQLPAGDYYPPPAPLAGLVPAAFKHGEQPGQPQLCDTKSKQDPQQRHVVGAQNWLYQDKWQQGFRNLVYAQ